MKAEFGPTYGKRLQQRLMGSEPPIRLLRFPASHRRDVMSTRGTTKAS